METNDGIETGRLQSVVLGRLLITCNLPDNQLVCVKRVSILKGHVGPKIRTEVGRGINLEKVIFLLKNSVGLSECYGVDS